MTSDELKAQLLADSDTYAAAGTAAEKLVALNAWVVDISQALVAGYQKSERADTDANETATILRHLLRQLLDRRVIWNPQLRARLGKK